MRWRASVAISPFFILKLTCESEQMECDISEAKVAQLQLILIRNNWTSKIPSIDLKSKDHRNA
jgi:hypothetical protein